MGNNAKQSVRTKHIDVKYHFIREHVMDGMVKIIFVPSEEMTQTSSLRMSQRRLIKDIRRNL